MTKIAILGGSGYTARELIKPYCVVLNAAPAMRDAKESPVLAHSRAFLNKHEIPVWSGQISQRAGFVVSLAAGDSAAHGAADSLAGVEMTRLWSAIERSVAAINGACADAATMHGRAA